MWVRFMLFKDGMWVDFEENAMDVMVSDFVSGEAIIEMEMEGCNLIFFLFWEIIEINLESGTEVAHRLDWCWL